MGREGDKGNKHGGINVGGIIEECDNYLLHDVNGIQGGKGGVVDVVGVVDFGAVGGVFPGMGGIPRARRLRVLELV